MNGDNVEMEQTTFFVNDNQDEQERKLQEYPLRYEIDENLEAHEGETP
jgi:hypothetical protein